MVVSYSSSYSYRGVIQESIHVFHFEPFNVIQVLKLPRRDLKEQCWSIFLKREIIY